MARRRSVMRITIIGASGGIGAELVKQARAAGHQVVKVGRSMKSEPGPDVTPVQGSIVDRGVAERAVSGADAVAWCVGVKTLGPAALRTVTVFSEGTRRTIEAMKGAGVSRLAVSPGSVRARAEGTTGFYTTGSGCPLLLGPSTPTRIGKRLS